MKPREPEAATLAVDLDGTLLRGDLLWEGLAKYLLPRIWRIGPVCTWLIKGGRPLLKARIAAATTLHAESLPWNDEVVRFCTERAAAGVSIVVTTAADADLAKRATGCFPFVSRVIGSEPGTNLKGDAKAARLIKEFGAAGFDYIGDSAADVPVWQSARNAWFVGSDGKRERLEKLTGKALHAATSPQTEKGASLLEAMRPHQWLKNLLVFVPLCTAHFWDKLDYWQATVPVFLALCCLASAAYLLNDLADLDADRAHPRKRNRPFAGGAVGIPAGLGAAAALVALGLTLAAFAGPAALGATAGYFALSLLYSLLIKTIPVFDGVFLSSLYTYRMVIGGVAGGVMISPWLLAFSTTFFLGLAFLKRFVELTHLPEDQEAPLARRGYVRTDLGFVLSVGMASGFLSVVVLALYLDSSASKALYGHPQWLWLIALVLLFWIMRVWFLAGRKLLHDDPVWFAARDWVTWGLGVLCAMAVAAAHPF
jgi:4-hydroxybenzoate polyprenyltransferase